MTTRRATALFQCLAVLVLTVVAGTASGQVGTAAIMGQVTDASGGVLPGASVTLKNTDTGVSYSAVTNAEGRYAIPGVNVGTYDVTTELQGFTSSVRTGLRLGVGQQAELNVQLQVGAVSETVSVTALAVAVETASSALGTRVSEHQIENLPLNGRNFDQLSSLAPGVTPVAPQARPGAGFGSNASYSFAGLRPEGQAILLDGANLQGFWSRGSGSALAGTSLGVEAVGEFQVLTNTFGAQFAGFGAVVNGVTRSGTNLFHGSAYEFYRNSGFDARNFFDSPSGPPEFHRHQFGGTVGGPLKTNKAFFFVNYEGLRQALALTNIGFVPNANTRSGLLPCSSLDVVPVGCDRSNPALVNIGVSPIIQPYLALYPPPNGPDIGGGIARLTLAQSAPLEENYVNARADYVLSSSDNLFARYVLDGSSLYSPSTVPGYGTFGTGRNHFLTIQERKVIGPALVNTASFHFARTYQLLTPEATGASVTLLNFLGGDDQPAGTLSSPVMSSIGGGSYNLTVQTSYTASDSVSWVRGAHALTFGGEVSRVSSEYNQPLVTGGSYTFLSLNQLLGARPFSLIGAPPGFNNAARAYRETRVAPYLQDDWKVTRRLTLNLGLRYDFMTNPSEKDGVLFAVTDPVTSTAFQQVPRVFASNPTTRNFNPRAGFAWSPSESQKTSIRGGIGRYTFLLTARNYGLGYAFSPPFQLRFAVNPTFPRGASALSALAPSVTLATPYSQDTTPYAWQYNVNVQREVYSGAIVTIGYLGSRGEHLTNNTNVNPPVPATRLPDGRYVRARGPGLNPAFSALSYLVDSGVSRFNAVQLSLSGRGGGLQYLVGYDYSRCNDNGSSSVAAAGTQGIGDALTQTDVLDPMRDYGRCAFQPRHVGKGSVVYQLPWSANRLVSGWQVSLIAMARSGLPFSPYIAFDIANEGQPTAQFRPDLVPGKSDNPVLGDPAKWFDPSAFTMATIPAGTYGTLPRDTIDGPSLVTFDLALHKETPIGRGVRLQLRAEVFNLFNRPNFSLPNQQVFNSPSGVPSATAGIITSTITTARQIQLGAKLVF